MDRVRIAQLYADADELGEGSVTVAGWVKSVRDMKNCGFVTLNDGSCFKDLQVVMSRELLGSYDAVATAGVGAALVVTGTLVLTPDRPQPFELQASRIDIEGEVAEGYPMQKKRTTVEFLRTVQHLRPRTNLFRAVFRVRSVAAHAIHCFFQDRGFVYVHTPIITTADAEGAGEMFRVTTLDVGSPPHLADGAPDWGEDFFGRPASLTVSGQLNGENFALAFGDIYTFGPTFRAENSNTKRHAAEFWMIEPEIAFADLDDDMDLAEDMLRHVIRTVMETCPDELGMLNRFVDKGLLARLGHVSTAEFSRITYTEAIGILEGAAAQGVTFEYPVSWGCDLQTEHERYLTERHFGQPVFVTDYPAGIKAFYMRLNDDGKTVAATDCLVPGIGEIIGGSQREERLDVLERRIAELGMDAGQYRHYLDLRRFGGCRHAGFGLGFERLVMYLTGVSNIRDVLPHPRTVGSAEF